MSVIGSLRNSFLNISEAIHYVSLPIQPKIPEHLTPYESFLELYYLFVHDDNGLGQKGSSTLKHGIMHTQPKHSKRQYILILGTPSD